MAAITQDSLEGCIVLAAQKDAQVPTPDEWANAKKFKADLSLGQPDIAANPVNMAADNKCRIWTQQQREYALLKKIREAHRVIYAQKSYQN